jgi:hypothetical protein
MPRWRKLHVKTVDSLDINDMPDDFTRLLWILLPLGLDSEGRGIDNPSWVKAKVMPLREDVTTKQVQAALDWFESRGMICCYEIGARHYFYIPTWHTYQGDTKREATSVLPAPPDLLTTNSRPAHELLTSKSCLDVDSYADSDVDSERQEEEPSLASDFFSNAITAFQDDIGIISGGHQADEMREFLDELEYRGLEAWWQGAIDIAVDQNKRSWAYVRGVLRNCIAEGRAPVSRASPPTKPTKQLVTVVDPETGESMEVEAIV